MKIALCFLTYGNVSQPELWSKIIENQQDRMNMYIHNKYDFEDTIYSLDRFCINNRLETCWGHNSLVEATLRLFDTAFHDDEENAFFVLLSDHCIPLYSFEHIYQHFVDANTNIIDTIYASMERYEYVSNKDFFHEDDFIKHSQWLMLKRNSVKMFIENIEWVSMFDDDFFALDEHYFGLICNKFNVDYISRPITYVEWNNSYPVTFTELTNETIHEIKIKGTMFLRKVSETCVLPSYFDNL